MIAEPVRARPLLDSPPRPDQGVSPEGAIRSTRARSARSSPRPPPSNARPSRPDCACGARLRELIAHREVLVNLVRKELKVKYTASVLGAVWSLLNPVVFLAVFSLVVDVLGNDVPDFPVFLLSGLLAWNFFSSALSRRAHGP